MIKTTEEMLAEAAIRDQVERREGDWRIAERVLLLDCWRMDPVSNLGTAPDVDSGRRDSSDRSYIKRRLIALKRSIELF